MTVVGAAKITGPIGSTAAHLVIGVLLNGQPRWMDVQKGTFEFDNFGGFRFNEADWPEVSVHGVIAAVMAYRVDGA